jgi:hypothetical protein
MSKVIVGLIFNALLSWFVYQVLVSIEDPKKALAWIGSITCYMLLKIEDKL